MKSQMLSPQVGKKTKLPMNTISINNVPGVKGSSGKKEKEKGATRIGKEEIKLLLLMEYTIECLQMQKNYTLTIRINKLIYWEP